MICKLRRNLTHSCGYQLPTITEMYFLNYGDLNGYTTDVYDYCEFINSIDYDNQFYKVEGTNVSYTDALIVDDYQRYREKRLTFNIYGKDDACRLSDYDVLAKGKFVVLIQIEGQWILSGFANGMEADNNELSTENDFYIELAENSVVSSLPVDDAVAEAIIHNEPQPVQKNYLTFTALQSGTFSFTPKDNSEPLYYSTDNGETWNEMTGETPTIASGNKVMFKGELVNNSGVGTFSSTGRYNVGGNIMSLLYGDDFEDKTSLSGQNNVFLYLFANNTNIVNAENLELPATTLSDNCYLNMFSGCTNMQYGPELPATTLAGACYGGMFRGCSSLIEAPELPATAATQGCYASMFWGCSSLDEAPDLPATTLASVCYSDMFRNCTSLEYAPELPATTLAQQCYKNMFRGCTALEEAPELSASTLVSNCYEYMFYSCRSLNNITMLAEDISATNAMSNWVSGVSATGDFYKLADTDVPVDSVSGVPVGWTLHNIAHDYSQDYLTFVALQDGTFSFKNNNSGNTIQYSLDNGETWTTLEKDTPTPTISSGSSIMWKGEMTPTAASGVATFYSSMQYEAKGNPMSLLFGDNFVGVTSLNNKDYALKDLFYGDTNLISAEHLSLPATTLANDCYYAMFLDCTSLVTAPSILPATTLAKNCYYSMFWGCTSLTTAPELPATTLAKYCYSDMFHGCRNLMTAPDLPAETLVSGCYHAMFEYCSSLNYIKMLATDISESSGLYYWVNGVQTESGTFVKSASVTLPTGDDGIPTGWTVVDDL